MLSSLTTITTINSVCVSRRDNVSFKKMSSEVLVSFTCLCPDEQTWLWRSARPCRSNPVATYLSSPSAREEKWPLSTCRPQNMWVSIRQQRLPRVERISSNSNVTMCLRLAFHEFWLLYQVNHFAMVIFSFVGQARAPAHPRLRGRCYETADGVAGIGHPKVGGPDRLRERHENVQVHCGCQTTTYTDCEERAEETGGDGIDRRCER